MSSISRQKAEDTMNRSLSEEQPTRRGIRAFFKRKWQAFKGAASDGGQHRLDDPLAGEPVVAGPQTEVDLSGPTKVPLDSIYDLHGMKLREGSFVATRRSDGQEVLLNVVPRRPKNNVALYGFRRVMDRKVALNVLLSEREQSQHVQQMHGWFEEEKKVVLVYENLSTCLEKYIKKSGGQLREAEARGLFKQAAEGVKHSLDHGVYHQEVFDRKFLIDERTKMLKLRVFGNEKRITSVHELSQFKGRAFDLQNLETDRYYAELATVWSLGKLAYTMIHGHETYESKKGKKLNLDSSLSRECCDFLTKCLENNPMHRISLEEMMAHEWMKGVEEGLSDPDIHEPDVSDPVPGPFHLIHTADVELPGPTTAPLDSTNQVNEKQLFEGAFMTQTHKLTSAGRKVILKVLTQDAKGVMQSLSWVQEDC